MILDTSKKTIEVLRVIATWPGYTAQAISEETGMTMTTVKNHLETLEEEKLIEGSLNGSKDKRYFVSEGLALLYHYALRQFRQEALEAAHKIERVTTGVNFGEKTGGKK